MDGVTKILILKTNFFHQLHKQTLLGFFHPGGFVLGEPLDGFVPIPVAEVGLVLICIQVHGGVVFQQIQDQLLLLAQLPWFSV